MLVPADPRGLRAPRVWGSGAARGQFAGHYHHVGTAREGALAAQEALGGWGCRAVRRGAGREAFGASAATGQSVRALGASGTSSPFWALPPLLEGALSLEPARHEI